VPQEFLHGPNIVPVLQQVRSKAVAQRMAIAALIELRLAYRLFDCLLEHGFGQMMAAFSPGAWIASAFGGWEHILPLPRRSSMWVCAGKSLGQRDLSIACRQVFLM